jgi:hypothetical protein
MARKNIQVQQPKQSAAKPNLTLNPQVKSDFFELDEQTTVMYDKTKLTGDVEQKRVKK